ncbi:MAG: TVP38/TMEM64 family protein [Bauldia sp.]|nr:TVP38/TMEM64 family protein [Bauldia sp.]
MAIALAVLAAAGVAIWLAWPYLSVFTDPDRARALIESAGALGPLIFIGLQIIQVFVAPIPGQVTALAGGLLFGPWLGLLYTMIGAAIGFTLIFVLVRRFGRPFVEKFVSGDLIERFDALARRGGAFVLLLVFLLPAFPDDIISFVAGLTPIPIRTLLLVSLAGRLPGYAVLAFTGDALAADNLNVVIVVAIALVAIGGVAFWKRDWLMEMARSGRPIAFIRERWTLSPLRTAILAAVLVAAVVGLYFLATGDPLGEGL